LGKKGKKKEKKKLKKENEKIDRSRLHYLIAFKN